MGYPVVLLKRAERDLAALPKKDQARIMDRILALADDPRPPGSKKLTGRENQYRLRIGDYRVIYSVNDHVKVVTILVIGHRGSVYD